MSTRTILSPGVEVRERDLSLVAPNNVGTTVFVTGFANQGPSDEVLKITTRDELELIYGTPTNSAERYFYHTVRELLNSPANIYTSRLPYGLGTGNGFTTKYSALVYPAKSVVAAISGYTFNVGSSSTTASVLSAATFSLTISDGSTKTFGFSSTGFNPLSTSYNGYANLTGLGPFTQSSLILAISASVLALDTSATLVSAGQVLTYALGTNQPTTVNYSFVNAPTGHTYSIATGPNTDTSTNTLNVSAGTYVLGNPTHMELTDTEYQSIIEGSAFTWNDTASTSFSSLSDLGEAGVVVLNKSQTAINDQFEGYYIGIGDNFNLNPGTAFNSITGVNTLNSSLTSTATYIPIPAGTLQFQLTAAVNGASNSISQVMENLTDYQPSETQDADLLNIGVFKLRKSLFSTEAFKLDYVLDEKVVGSIDYFKTINDENSGPAISYFLESTDENSRNTTVLVNDYISNRLGKSSIVNGTPLKKVRVLTKSLIDNNNQTTSGVSTSTLNSLVATLGFADNLYPLGAYTGVAANTKDLGDIPTKLDRALDAVRNDDIYELDLVIEAGLGTIYAAASGAGTAYYDETNYNSNLSNQLSGLRTTGTPSNDGTTLRNNYMTIFNKFANFCEPGYIGGGRGDCMFVADPLRHIFVTGTNNKIAANKNSIYQRDIYWALRHLFSTANTSYAAAYANWSKVYDSYSGQQVWAPFSGFAAAAIARNDAARYPWIAPAGFTNGLVTNALELASTPNQKQRDELYKVNLNPVTFFPAQGNVIYGQKTLSRKPSAFDRINVRRLFLALERPSKKLSQFFVFEPNTTFTRTRLVNALVPIFDRAKNTEGVYDYLIVCDERNNTPQVIDNNELVVDFYIKPVRASEFILLNFIATRTDTNFREIIGG